MSVHECVREAHFGSIDDAIPYAFYQRKDVVVLWVEDNLLQRSLRLLATTVRTWSLRCHTSSVCNLSMSRSQRRAPLCLGTRKRRAATSHNSHHVGAARPARSTRSLRKGTKCEGAVWLQGVVHWTESQVGAGCRLWRWARPTGIWPRQSVTLSAGASPHWILLQIRAKVTSVVDM